MQAKSFSSLLRLDSEEIGRLAKGLVVLGLAWRTLGQVLRPLPAA